MTDLTPDRTPDFDNQYAIERRSVPVNHWHRILVLMVGTDLRGAKRQLADQRKDEPDAEYRLVRRPATSWEPVDA